MNGGFTSLHSLHPYKMEILPFNTGTYVIPPSQQTPNNFPTKENPKKTPARSPTRLLVAAFLPMLRVSVR